MANKRIQCQNPNRVQVKQAYVEEHGDPFVYFCACVMVCLAAFGAFVMLLIAAGNYYG